LNDIVAAVRVAVAVATLLAVCAGSAAAKERIAVAVFAVTGQPLSQAAQTRLRNSLHGGLAAAGFDVVPDEDVDKAIAANGLAGCDTLSCMRRIGELVMVPRVGKVTVEVVGNTHVVSHLDLIDLETGKSVASANDNCDVCTMKEVNDGLSNAAAALRTQLEPPPPPRPAPPPPPPPPSTPETPVGKKIMRGTSVAAMSGGLLAISLGIWKATQNHSVSCDPGCSRLDTTAGEATALTIGIAAVLGGATLSVLGWRHEAKKSPIALAPNNVQLRF
jgi:hypothetical protein